MKKFIRFLCVMLAVLSVVSLASCSEDEEESVGKKKGSGSKENSVELHENGEVKISLDGATKIGDVAEVELVRAFASKDVKPPKPNSVYTHYEAKDGYTYFVVVMDVKNMGGDAVCAEDIFEITLEAADDSYDAKTVIEADEGASFDYGSLTDIDPLVSVRIYQLFSVPEDTDTEGLKLVIKDGEDIYSAKFSMDSFADRVEELTVGTEVTDGKTIAFTVEGVEFKSMLEPPSPEGYHSYFQADDGKTYLILKMTVKNLKSTDMKYSSVAGASCVYDGKYNYSFFPVFEEDGGKDLSSYADLYYISPLDTGVMYYLSEVPEEVEGGPVKISLYIAGKYYSYEVK